jgi:hypothetical protein
MDLETLKYPIGKVVLPTYITKKNIKDWLFVLETFPQNLEFLTRELSENQLDTPYRENGWSIRQVVHHCFDSHLNAYIRFKWALTEDKPLIKAYFEERWAALNDSKSAPIFLSIDGLKALHAKWIYLINNLKDEDLDCYFIHPTSNSKVTLKENIGIYAWQCNHHFAHIEQLMVRKSWK